jgi:hypothetical protein
MAQKVKHWGEFEDGIDEQLAYVPKNSLNTFIDLALQPNINIENNPVTSFVNLPVQNVTLQTVKLVEHSRRAAAALSAGEVPLSPPDCSLFQSKFEKKLASTSFQTVVKLRYT